MLIGTKQKVSQYCNYLKTLGLTVDAKEISNRSSYACLGLAIDCHLTWNEAVLSACKKISTTIAMLHRLILFVPKIYVNKLYFAFSNHT